MGELCNNKPRYQRQDFQGLSRRNIAQKHGVTSIMNELLWEDALGEERQQRGQVACAVSGLVKSTNGFLTCGSLNRWVVNGINVTISIPSVISLPSMRAADKVAVTGAYWCRIRAYTPMSALIFNKCERGMYLDLAPDTPPSTSTAPAPVYPDMA